MYRRLHNHPTALMQLNRIVNEKSSNKEILKDLFDRKHDYLRISLTERCNLRCYYCMPNEGIDLTPKQHLLTTPEILKLAQLFVKKGVTKIRLTGGEPTICKDLRYIIEYLRDLRKVQTIAITTNGLTLTRCLSDLQKAGLNALNISLDTLKEDKFLKITKRNGLSKVIAGINYAITLGFEPVKINCVVVKNVNDDEILDFVELTKDKNIDVRFIEYMPFTGNKWQKEKLFTYLDLITKIKERYPNFHKLENSNFSETSKPYKVPNFKGQVGFISPISNHFCYSCNRLRLLADGSLKVCLFSSAEISLRDALRNGCSEEDILSLIRAALLKKKSRHDDTRLVFNRILLMKIRNFCTDTRNNNLTHCTSNGKAAMVDVSSKSRTVRYACAYAEVYVGKEILKLIEDNDIQKGDVLTVAKLAGIMGAKRTSELIPLCHNISLSFVNVQLNFCKANECVQIISQVRCTAETGVEIEALTAVTIAALTIYDMCKSVSHNIVIKKILLLEKSGGKMDFKKNINPTSI